MSWDVTLRTDAISLHNDKIDAQDAERQMRTAEDILRRLAEQPGVILADEVGMGKTFVALAVAASAYLQSRRQPVVVMVPSSLKQKWPLDFSIFREKCVAPRYRNELDFAVADRATELFKLFDDPRERRKSLIFLTHGALTRSLQDEWVKLALIRATFQRRKRLAAQRRAFPRFAAELLLMKKWKGVTPEIYERLLVTRPDRWRKLLAHHGIELADDPVPEALCEGIASVDKTEIAAALETLPLKRSASLHQRLNQTRRALSAAIARIWKTWLAETRIRSPLLILDEAHHFKNPSTQYASLFADEDAEGDAELVRGPLAGVFERMLFLTATPFQLGHRELCEVLRRFRAIRWHGRRGPASGRVRFDAALDGLSEALDQAQLAALRFEQAWGALSPAELGLDVTDPETIETWWDDLADADDPGPAEARIRGLHAKAADAARAAEAKLRPWIIRHAKPRYLASGGGARRVRLEGKAIVDPAGPNPAGRQGLPVNDQALLPFLLASRAAVAVETASRRNGQAASRAVFAEGLASSYEAYRDTRVRREALDTEASAADPLPEPEPGDGEVHWYLERLDRALPPDEPDAHAAHPKVGVTVKRALDLWSRGEKVLIFSHFVRTTEALRDHISREMDRRILDRARSALAAESDEALRRELDLLGDSFFKDTGLREMATAEIGRIVERHRGLTEGERDTVVDTVRRFLRTPSFLVRFFPLDSRRRSEGLRTAMDAEDASGLSLRQQIDGFCHFLGERCTEGERNEYLTALKKIQTGTIYTGEAREVLRATGESPGAGLGRLPNVRLVYGKTPQQTRRLLMLTFNTPFFPEVLVSSSVLAEGVDLHLFCRHVIHHDLDWNPSVLEQRTGRIDRLGCKAETAGRPIKDYLPFIAGTHDEKQFRVVTDRERWFAVVMGQRLDLSEHATSRLESRLPLPQAAARPLTMRLAADPTHDGAE